MRVELHFERLDAPPDEVARLERLLDPAECRRAAGFRREVHRRRFVVRRGRLRLWLGERLGQQPGAVKIVADANGKPFVPGWDRHFSTSHSGERMLIASASAPIGCDIEAIAPDFDWRPVAKRLFAREERQALVGLDDEAGRLAFFRCWARKEAFVKALGLGLAYPLDAFAVSCAPEARFLRGAEGWAITAADLPGHAGAVAGPASAVLPELESRIER